MDEDQFLTDAESENGDTQDDISMNSDDDNNSASLDVGEDQNHTDDDINIPEMLKTLKHVQEAFSGFAKIVEKRAKSRRSGDHKRAGKSKTTFRGKGKSTAGASTSDRAYSRFNSKYFGEIIAQLDARKKKIIGAQGFGNLLEYDGCSPPRAFVQWIADQIDLNCCDIVVGGKLIPISPEAVHVFLGIPLGGEDIAKNHNDSGKSKFLTEINESSLPLIKTFGDKLLGDSLSDDDVFRYFMVVALSTFLCANSSTLPSTKYLGALIDIPKVKEWDWSKYVCDWLLHSISRYKKKSAKTIGGCIYFLAGYYLDFVNFGKCNELPPNLPRILCWKGNMIKKFASFDRVFGEKYGKRPVKSIEDTCYAEELLPEDACESFRNYLDRDCNFFRVEDKDCMCEIFKKHHTRDGYRDPGLLVANLFNYLHEFYGRGSTSRESDENAEPDDNADDISADVVHAAEEEYAEEVCPNIPSPTNIPEQASDGAPSHIVEDVRANIRSPSKISQQEASVTEKIESDGAYDVFRNDSFRASQATVIISSDNSSAQDLGERKRKRIDYKSQSSPDSVSCRTRHGLSKRLGKSPLSHRKDDDTEARVLDHTGEGLTKDKPIFVDDGPLIISKGASKRQKVKETTKENVNLDVLKNVQVGSTPNLGVSEPKTIPCQSKETQQAENAASGKALVEKPCLNKKAPYFNSPSMPSFRLLDDEDDLGNYVDDPKLRRPIGTSSSAACTSAATTHPNIHINVQSDQFFYFQFRRALEGWTVIDKMYQRCNPFSPSGNVTIEETVETETKDSAETVDTQRNDNAQTDGVHMVSLPFTEIPEESVEPVPIAAISPTGEHIDIPW